jgi:hypothetical protein
LVLQEKVDPVKGTNEREEICVAEERSMAWWEKEEVLVWKQNEQEK